MCDSWCLARIDKPLHVIVFCNTAAQAAPTSTPAPPLPNPLYPVSGGCVSRRAGGGSSSDTQHSGGGTKAAGGITAPTQDTGLCSSSRAAQVVRRCAVRPVQPLNNDIFLLLTQAPELAVAGRALLEPEYSLHAELSGSMYNPTQLAGTTATPAAATRD
jgi:hypothetical protein